jgi:hypothetical protein
MHKGTSTVLIKRSSALAASLSATLSFATLAGCSQSVPVAQQAAPPAAVGHTYATLVAVPAPTTRHVHITPAQQERVQQAFNVIGLKSALMVGALSCNQQDRYDEFMNRFHQHILAETHVMDTYFHTIGGYHGQQQEDSFVTLLANNQSLSGNDNGNFCLNNAAEFDAVLALRHPAELDDFVTDQAPPAGSQTTVATIQQ